MEDKLTATIQKIEKLMVTNHEFKRELVKLTTPYCHSKDNVDDASRFDQIYEYCIERNIREQAKDFYKNFPIKDIVPILIEDYCRMESFKRKDNFGDFCLALYQQIECITNRLCENADISSIVEKMWACSAYVKSEKGQIADVSNRMNGDYPIAALVFPGFKDGLPNAVVKSKYALQSQYANDKMRILVYFLGYKAIMKSSDYDTYVEITSLLQDIYQCRNMNHRGNTLTQWEESTLERVSKIKSLCYFKFLGVLAQYVSFVENGLPEIPKIKVYADGLLLTKVSYSGPKIMGKIDLKDDGKKRFK